MDGEGSITCGIKKNLFAFFSTPHSGLPPNVDLDTVTDIFDRVGIPSTRRRVGTYLLNKANAS